MIFLDLLLTLIIGLLIRLIFVVSRMNYKLGKLTQLSSSNSTRISKIEKHIYKKDKEG